MEPKRNKKKFLIGVIILAIILVFGSVEITNAIIPTLAVTAANVADGISDIGNIATSAVVNVAKATGTILGVIAGVFLVIAGYLVQLTLNINFQLMESPVVLTGWQIVLNFANMGFVLAIIVIAFATILRIETYEMKKILWKLIVAALLVNFSLVIAGAFIDISHFLAIYFLTQGGITDPLAWSSAFAGMFEAQALLATDGGLEAAAAGVGMIASVFFSVFFTLLTVLTLLAVAIMLLIRYVVLGILLIISPIVWLLWIFPATESIWKKWWTKFLEWVFFAPIMIFFIYLALHAMQNQPEVMRSLSEVPMEFEAAGEAVGLTFGFDIIGNMIIVIGLVIGGLIAAKSLSITLADATLNAAQGGGKAFGSWVGRKGVRTAGWSFAGPSQRTQQWARRTDGGKIRKIIGKTDIFVRGRLNKIPVLKNLGQVYRRKDEHQNIAASVWGGMKSGSGLFKGKSEKKEKTEQVLGRLYTKKSSLQGELDLLQRIAPGALTPPQRQRLIDLPVEISKVNNKIQELEAQT